jgi:hypothetical protein
MNDLLDLFDVFAKSMYIDEHETYKAKYYLSHAFEDNTAGNLNCVKRFLSKLKIEEIVLHDRMFYRKNVFF